MIKSGKIIVAVLWTVWGSEISAMELDELESGEIYVSPTRLKQSPHDTPASVSRIDQETINNLQINSIPELLQYVAGMVVIDKAGNNAHINYHGTNGLSPRRMQVLLDGISVYRPSYAEIAWTTLPVSVRDIDYVEVTRSPSAATYGANAMMAAINIVTKRPVNAFSEVHLTGGEQGRADLNAVVSGVINKDLQYRVSWNHEENSGYDKNAAGEERRDDLNASKLNARLDYSLSPSVKGNFFVGYSDVLTELEYRDAGQISYPDVTTESYYVMSETNWAYSARHELTVKGYAINTTQDVQWRSCYPTIYFSENVRALAVSNQTYVDTLTGGDYPVGGSAADDALRDAILYESALLGDTAQSPTCGDVNEDGEDRKYELEIQDTLLINDDFRVVSGAGILYKRHSSETFLNGAVSNYAYRLFGNAEYRWNDFVFNIGAMIEEEERYLDQPSVSPRLGINYRLLENTTLRFIFSKAIRTPDILEEDRNWSYYARDLDPAYPLDGRTESYFLYNQKSGDIDPEEVIAREISLYTAFVTPLGSGSVSPVFDIKYFRNSHYNLISEKLQFNDFKPTNDGSVNLQGFEIDANVALDRVWGSEVLVEKLELHLNYAYIDNDTDDYYERSLHAQHSGGFYAIAHLQDYWLLSLAYTGSSDILGEAYDEFKFVLGKTFKFKSGELSLKGKLTYLPDLSGGFVGEGGEDTDTQKVHNINDSHTQGLISLTYKYY